MPRLATALALALAAGTLAACADAPVAPVPSAQAPLTARAASPDVVAGQYLVVLRPSIDGISAAGEPGVRTLATRKLGRGGAGLRRTFAHALHGFAAQLSDSAVAALRADPDVALVEPDPVMHVSGTQANAPWGLDRIDQAALPLDGSFRYANTGSGVTVYIIDTGINFTHVDFGGRAVAGVDYVTSGGTATDCHGHGTHVAGTVGGATYGVAKDVRLVAMRVLDCSGNGDGSSVISALDYVVQQKRATPATPVVVNMSLGGSASLAVDQAVRNAVAAGVTVVVAAGNSSADACTSSPARAAEAITVGATDGADGFASFSNWGSCVDLSAPGVTIASDYIGSTTATAWMSGTSMASPHTAGAAALYLSANPAATPAQVAAALTGNAVARVVNAPATTTTRLLNVAFLSGTPTAPTTSTTLASGAAANLCAVVSGGSTANGAAVVTGACDTTQSAQRFLLTATGALTVHDGAKCVDVMPPKAAGAAVVIWGCYASELTQHWSQTAAGELTNVQGLCLTAAGTTAGGALTLATCAGSANQKWTFGAVSTSPVPVSVAPATTMVSALGSDVCAVVSGGSTANGAAVVTGACDTTQSAQRFLLTATGALTVHDGAKCVDVMPPKAAGAAVVIWGCYASEPTQHWSQTAAGELTNVQGLCLAIAYGDAQRGRALTLAACNGSTAQRWTVARS